MNAVIKTSPQNNKVHFAVISSFVVTFILFFMDEGYYDLRWMADFGNWIAFAIYFSGLLFFQIMARVLFFKNMEPKIRDGLSFVVGVPTALFFLIFILFGASSIF